MGGAADGTAGSALTGAAERRRSVVPGGAAGVASPPPSCDSRSRLGTYALPYHLNVLPESISGSLQAAFKQLVAKSCPVQATHCSYGSSNRREASFRYAPYQALKPNNPSNHSNTLGPAKSIKQYCSVEPSSNAGYACQADHTNLHIAFRLRLPWALARHLLHILQHGQLLKDSSFIDHICCLHKAAACMSQVYVNCPSPLGVLETAFQACMHIDQYLLCQYDRTTGRQ